MNAKFVYILKTKAKKLSIYYSLHLRSPGDPFTSGDAMMPENRFIWSKEVPTEEGTCTTFPQRQAASGPVDWPVAHRAPSTAGQVVRAQRGHETQTHSPVRSTTGQPGDRRLRSQKGLVMRPPCRERVRNRAPLAWLQTGLPRGVCQSPRFPDPSQACQDRVILRWHGSSPQTPT